MKFNDHQTRLWKHMIRFLDDYINDKDSFSHVVGSLESALDAGEFKNDELIKKWFDFWEPLEIYNAVMLDKNEKPKKEKIIKNVEEMRVFLLEKLNHNNKPLTKDQVKDFLITLFPDFEKTWNSKDNYQKDIDGSYTYHGLFIVFSFYFKDYFNNFSDEQLKELFSKIESWHVPEASREDYKYNKVTDAQQLSNATFTCFLEYIAGEGFTERIKPFMGNKSLEYYSHYDH